jgi:NAD(P)-dependent dehydrogenase (short-subunit alcohol dehydrogenase family)
MSKPVAYKGFFDSALEASVAGSFTGVGLRMRKRLYTWEPLPPGALQGKVVVITGGTSGLGEHASMAMAKLGAHVTMVARDASKAARVCERLRELSGSAAIDAAQAEMGNLRAVRRAASELQERHGRGIDVLIHNAGALDAIYAESEEGIEQTVASQVAGCTASRSTWTIFACVPPTTMALLRTRAPNAPRSRSRSYKQSAISRTTYVYTACIQGGQIPRA